SGSRPYGAARIPPIGSTVGCCDRGVAGTPAGRHCAYLSGRAAECRDRRGTRHDGVGGRDFTRTGPSDAAQVARRRARCDVGKAGTMRIAHFRHLLETRGPDLSQWPEPWAEAGRRLAATNAAAARELDTMRRLESLLVAHMDRDAVDTAATARVMNALRGPLP